MTKNLVPRFLEDMTELIIDKREGDHPEVAGFERVYQVPKVQKKTSEFKQTSKNMTVVGKGIDHVNNVNYMSST